MALSFSFLVYAFLLVAYDNAMNDLRSCHGEQILGLSFLSMYGISNHPHLTNDDKTLDAQQNG